MRVLWINKSAQVSIPPTMRLPFQGLQYLTPGDPKANYLGKSLAEKNYRHEFVTVYRVLPLDSRTIRSNFHVTRKRRTSESFANRYTAVRGRRCAVVRAVVKAQDLYNVEGADHYVYAGDPVEGQKIYITKLI